MWKRYKFDAGAPSIRVWHVRMLPAAHVLTGRKSIIRTVMIAAATVAVLALSPTAFAQKPDYGTADEAKAMLMKAVAALKADKQKTLDLINEGEGGGFFDRDLYVFCANVSDGKSVAIGNPNARQLLGVDTRP